jgi:hypothetical protein
LRGAAVAAIKIASAKEAVMIMKGSVSKDEIEKSAAETKKP